MENLTFVITGRGGQVQDAKRLIEIYGGTVVKSGGHFLVAVKGAGVKKVRECFQSKRAAVITLPLLEECCLKGKRLDKVSLPSFEDVSSLLLLSDDRELIANDGATATTTTCFSAGSSSRTTSCSDSSTGRENAMISPPPSTGVPFMHSSVSSSSTALRPVNKLLHPQQTTRRYYLDDENDADVDSLLLGGSNKARQPLTAIPNANATPSPSIGGGGLASQQGTHHPLHRTPLLSAGAPLGPAVTESAAAAAAATRRGEGPFNASKFLFGPNRATRPKPDWDTYFDDKPTVTTVDSPSLRHPPEPELKFISLRRKEERPTKKVSGAAGGSKKKSSSLPSRATSSQSTAVVVAVPLSGKCGPRGLPSSSSSSSATDSPPSSTSLQGQDCLSAFSYSSSSDTNSSKAQGRNNRGGKQSLNSLVRKASLRQHGHHDSKPKAGVVGVVKATPPTSSAVKKEPGDSAKKKAKPMTTSSTNLKSSSSSVRHKNSPSVHVPTTSGNATASSHRALQNKSTGSSSAPSSFNRPNPPPTAVRKSCLPPQARGKPAGNSNGPTAKGSARGTNNAEHGGIALTPSEEQYLNRVRSSPFSKGLDDDTVISILRQIVDTSKAPLDFSQITGLDGCKQSLYEATVLPSCNPLLFTGLRDPVSGVLLFGPPGNGKTMLGKAVAKESQTTYFSISASAILSKWVGDSEKMVRTLFSVARALGPSTIFVDELDSMLQCRGSGSETESSRRLKTEFLVQMDGASQGWENQSELPRILVVAATNRPFDLDDAVLRRLPKRIFVPLPDIQVRKQQLKSLLQDTDMRLSAREWDALSAATEGYSGCDLRALCVELAMIPVRELGTRALTAVVTDLRPITFRDAENALRNMRPTASKELVGQLQDWNDKYGATSLA